MLICLVGSGRHGSRAVSGCGCTRLRYDGRSGDKDDLAIKTARLKTAVRLGHLIKGNPLGDARLDGTRFQQAKEPLQVLPEPGGMQCPHLIEYMRGCLPPANQLSNRLQRYTRKSNNKMEWRRLCACTLAV